MVTKKNGLSLDLIIHPGETIKELLEEKNMTQEELAIRCGYSAKHVSEVLSGKKIFPLNLLIRLNMFLEFQQNFGLIYKEIMIRKYLKLSEITSIIESGLNKALTLLNMRRFLNVNNLLSIPNLPIQQVVFRGSQKVKVNVNVLFAWKRICEFLTEKIEPSTSFDKNKLKEKYEDIKKTMFLEPNKMVSELKKIFLECGIAFEVVHNFAGAPVQGYIQKKNDKVILCMMIRQSFSDIFWFTLFHEIGHLMNDDFNDLYIDYNFIESEVEKRANNFARNTLINEDDYNIFIKSRKYDFITITKFAKSQNVKPGIVIGRIQKDIDDYTFMAKYRERYKWVNQI